MTRNTIQTYLSALINDTFYFLIVFLIVLNVLEYIYDGFVSNYLNINYILILIIICGIFLAFNTSALDKENISEELSLSFYIKLFIIAVICSLAVLVYAIPFGYIAFLLSALTFVSIMFGFTLLSQRD
jgi:hypothetical protein